MYTVRLKAGREKSLLRRHPWVFAGAIDSIQGAPADGDTVQVESHPGEFLAWAAYSSASQIRLRVWSWQADETIDAGFFRRRVERAITARAGLVQPERGNAVRLVHAESDGLPGLVVDRYADTLVAQFLSSGAEHWKETLADLLLELTGARRLYERSDAEVRRLEGLDEYCGPLRGAAPPERLQVIENGLKFWVDVAHGHKTGYYLDQRDNRQRLMQMAAGRQVLDCFAYTGGFTIHALAGRAESVLAVDSSAEVLALARDNLALNELPVGRAELLEGDVFQVLRQLRDRRQTFDMIVLDPPKFAPTAALAEQAARGYKDINLLALKLLRPGGLLFTFSCSGGVSADLFQKIVAGAALDAGVQAQIIDYLHQAPDHPVALNFPEGAYLKGLVLRVG
ncbi:MAG: 23S rRNA methyltransferase [Chloroflexi bacterium RBG_16_57_11]|nr:MAG: 23S rRNA methyltransferase [Chloroflexi bacterium RBG_16_57_11]